MDRIYFPVTWQDLSDLRRHPAYEVADWALNFILWMPSDMALDRMAASRTEPPEDGPVILHVGLEQAQWRSLTDVASIDLGDVDREVALPAMAYGGLQSLLAIGGAFPLGRLIGADYDPD